MRQSKQDIDDLVDDESASVDTGRTNFADVQTSKKSYPGLRAFVGIMGILCVAAVGWFIYNQAKQKPTPKEEVTAAQKAAGASSLPGRKFGDPSDGQTTPRVPAPSTIADGPPGDASAAPNDPEAAARAAAAAEAARQQKYEADIMKRRLGNGQGAAAGDAGGSDHGAYRVSGMAAGGQPAKGGNVTADDDAPTPKSKDSAALQERMGGAKVMRVHATRLLHPRFTVAGGTLIPCGTVTELDTTVPGQVACTVTRDVYSADGTVRLIDKGAKVTGEVSGGIKQGEARVFVLWTRLRNPDNVTINVMSPGAGPLGAAGIGGQVDSHFWTRFGGAMFVSIFSDTFKGLVTAATNSVGNNTTVNLDTTSNTTDSMAREALQATINIPPTLYTHQGTNVNIFVRNDLDFSDVYGLAADNSDGN